MDSEPLNRESEWIDINTASAQTLSERVPGIGPDQAERIVAYRQAHGPFAHVNELLDVPGVNQDLLDHIAPVVTPVRAEKDWPDVPATPPVAAEEPLVRPPIREYGAPEPWDLDAGERDRPVTFGDDTSGPPPEEPVA
ncbi:MAG: ComEA family DNA-binding protein, partial [Anaerolineae bacterium]